MKSVCIIPSRYASSRLPGKPLIDICGKPLIQRVYECAALTNIFDDVIVATDDERIFSEVKRFRGKAVMSPSDLATGTDRVARVVDDLRLNHEVIVNLQGDEPLIEPEDFRKLVGGFQEFSDTQMASLFAPLTDELDLQNPNNVKVVVDHQSFALYFSRHPIPFWRNQDSSPWHQHPATYRLHIGIYAFSKPALQKFASCNRSELELSEGLEQLRALQAGVRIRMLAANHPYPGVNTIEDVERVRLALKNRGE